MLVAQKCPDIWRRIRERGDEIGLHIHLSPEVGPKGREQKFWWHAHEFQHLFLEESVSRMVDFGFDPPKTYTPGGQVWRREWASALLKAGFEVDSTIMALPSKYLVWPGLFEHVYEADITPYLMWSHRPESYPFRPYRTAADDLVAEGDSELVELPVIGWIGCDIYPDQPYFRNSPPFDCIVPVADLEPRNWIADGFLKFEKEEGKPFPGLHERWERRHEVPVDIWPTLFHPLELHEKNLQRMDRFMRAVLSWEDVSFCTAHDAGCQWKSANARGDR